MPEQAGRSTHGRRRCRLASLFLLLAGLCGLAPVSAKADGLTLERVVLVQRHGVRAPTQSPETLAGWTRQPWPAWPAGRGDLTAHGAQVVALVGQAMRKHFAEAGLLAASGCPGDGAVGVWADANYQRTRDSGQALAESLAPGCKLQAAFTVKPGTKLEDPVFNSLGRACVLQRADAQAAFDAAIKTSAGPRAIDPASATALLRLNEVLLPGSMPVVDPPTSLIIRKTGMELSGPLEMGSTVAEIFLLEYAQGFQPADVAWGALNDLGTAALPAARDASVRAQLDAVMAAHRRATFLTRNLPYLAVRRGAGMARLILATLAGDTRAADPVVGADVKVLALAGHDTNLSNMAGTFGLSWSLPNQPDPTAPATALVFELWRDAAGQRSVTATVWYAELEGMRTLNPASVHAVAVPFAGCGPAMKGACPLADLSKRVLAAIPDACGKAP